MMSLLMKIKTPDLLSEGVTLAARARLCVRHTGTDLQHVSGEVGM